jgi:hypothetical protein
VAKQTTIQYVGDTGVKNNLPTVRRGDSLSLELLKWFIQGMCQISMNICIASVLVNRLT